MKTHRTIRYRLHPQTQAKANKLWAAAGACRYVWNHFVSVLRDEYVFYGQCDPRHYSGMFKLNGDWLHVQKIGQMRLTGHNPYHDARVVNGTIRHEHGDWYVYIAYEVGREAVLPHVSTEAGIDRNVGQITLSDGRSIARRTPHCWKRGSGVISG